MSKQKKILKGISFTYLIEGEEKEPDSIFSGYYKDIKVSEDKWLEFYHTLSSEQKMLLLKLWN
jgi:hypothetical protein